MKPLKAPAYVEKRQYHLWHQVPGHGLCPVCGRFAPVQRTDTGEYKKQYRKCDCGNTFTSVSSLGIDN